MSYDWSQEEVVYFVIRKDWRDWLEQNFEQKSDVWLLYPKKKTGKPRISYNDAVEEALCFGWIDSKIRAYDPETSAQRFSVRKTKAPFSQQNKERIRWLHQHNLIHPTIINSIEKYLKVDFVFPEDILDRLKEDNLVWKNYNKFSDAYKRIRIAYIDSARKRGEEFDKRISNFIKKTRENKSIGFGGIEKYY